MVVRAFRDEDTPTSSKAAATETPEILEAASAKASEVLAIIQVHKRDFSAPPARREGATVAPQSPPTHPYAPPPPPRRTSGSRARRSRPSWPWASPPCCLCTLPTLWCLPSTACLWCAPAAVGPVWRASACLALPCAAPDVADRRRAPAPSLQISTLFELIGLTVAGWTGYRVIAVPGEK